MNPEGDFRSFFGDLKKREDIDLDGLFYVMVSEWHWTQEDIMNSDIPFVLSLFLKRKEVRDREADVLRKSKRR